MTIEEGEREGERVGRGEGEEEGKREKREGETINTPSRYLHQSDPCSLAVV